MYGRVLAGDFKITCLNFGAFKGATLGTFKKVNLKNLLQRVDTITGKNKKDIEVAFGLSVLGGLTFGPLGALAGIVFGGRKQEYCVACYLIDGRKFLAQVDNEALIRLQSIVFNRKG